MGLLKTSLRKRPLRYAQRKEGCHLWPWDWLSPELGRRCCTPSRPCGELLLLDIIALGTELWLISRQANSAQLHKHFQSMKRRTDQIRPWRKCKLGT